MFLTKGRDLLGNGVNNGRDLKARVEFTSFWLLPFHKKGTYAYANYS